jgi:hypothetical protein
MVRGTGKYWAYTGAIQVEKAVRITSTIIWDVATDSGGSVRSKSSSLSGCLGLSMQTLACDVHRDSLIRRLSLCDEIGDLLPTDMSLFCSNSRASDSCTGHTAACPAVQIKRGEQLEAHQYRPYRHLASFRARPSSVFSLQRQGRPARTSEPSRS